MGDFDAKRIQIARRLRPLPKSERQQQIDSINERARNEGIKLTARNRHERRHQGKKGTSLKEWKDHVALMSKG